MNGKITFQTVRTLVLLFFPAGKSKFRPRFDVDFSTTNKIRPNIDVDSTSNLKFDVDSTSKKR